MLFPKSVLRDLARDNGPDDYTVKADEIVGKTRWSIVHNMVFQHQGRLFSVNYTRGATECQDERPFEHEPDMVECAEVYMASVLTTVFLPNKPAPQELRIVVSGEGPDVMLVEVEDAAGKSVAPAEVRARPDGLRELVFTAISA